MISIDLATRLIPTGHQAYMARAGKGGWMYSQAAKGARIAMEVPLLELPSTYTKLVSADYDAEWARLAALRSWSSQPKSSRGKRPSISLNDYKGVKAPARSIGRLKTAIKALYYDTPERTLIVVPSRTAYFGHAIIAELVGPEENRVRIDGRRDYSGLWVPAREFRKPKFVEMRHLPGDFLSAAASPLALQLLPREAREEIYKLYYGTYVYGDRYTAELNTKKSKFTDLDAVMLPALARVIAANTDAIQRGERPNITLVEAAFNENAQPLDLRINVQSPGYFSFVDDSVKPIVFAAVFALAASVGPEAQAQAHAGGIQIVNSLDEDYANCLKEAEVATNKLLQQMGEKDFKDVCDRVKSLTERTGAQAGVKISK